MVPSKYDSIIDDFLLCFEISMRRGKSAEQDVLSE